MIDETFFDYEKYDADRKAASEIGEEISFREALFKDPETGLYPKIFGDTESRNKRAEIEKDRLDNEDRGFLPTPRFDSDQTVNMESIIEEMVPLK